MDTTLLPAAIVVVLVALAVWGLPALDRAVPVDDPAQAGGLDEALKTLTELPFGVALLGVVAVGLIAYGAFCFARARWPKL